MTLTERIKILAEAKGLTLPELGERVGVGRTAMYKWDKSSPSADKLLKVANYLGVSMEYLLGVDENTDETDREFITITRKAREMTPEQRKKALKLWEAVFDDEELWGKE